MKRFLVVFALALLTACAEPAGGYNQLAPQPTYGAVAGGTIVAQQATQAFATAQAFAATGDAYNAQSAQSTADAQSTHSAATAAAGNLSLQLTVDSATAIARANSTGTAVVEHQATQTATAQAFVNEQHQFETQRARVIQDAQTTVTAVAIIADAEHTQTLNTGRVWIFIAALVVVLVFAPFMLAQGGKRWLESRAVKAEADARAADQDAESRRLEAEARARAIEREAEARAWEIEQRARSASLRRIGDEIVALIGSEQVRWKISTQQLAAIAGGGTDEIPQLDEPSKIVVHTIKGEHEIPRYPPHVQEMLDFLCAAASIAPEGDKSTFIPCADDLNKKAGVTRKRRQPLVNILKSIKLVKTEQGGETGGTYLRHYHTLGELATAIRNGEVEIPAPASPS